MTQITKPLTHALSGADLFSVRSNFLGRVICLLLGFACSSLLAQNYPNKPIKVVIPFAAGSATDQIGRALSLIHI